MTGRPALTLLHLGPGLVNGLANLHNARRAGSPVVNPVGEHATWHRPHDPALASGIRSLAAAVSGWVRTATSPGTLAADGAAAAAGRWRPWSCRPAASGSPAASQQRSSSPGGSAHGSVMV